MASKKKTTTTTTQTVKPPKVGTKKPKGYDDLVFKNEKSSLKLKKTTKEEPVDQPSILPVEKPKKRNIMEKGSEEAKAWSEKMKAAREAKKAERMAQTTPVSV